MASRWSTGGGSKVLQNISRTQVSRICEGDSEVCVCLVCFPVVSKLPFSFISNHSVQFPQSGSLLGDSGFSLLMRSQRGFTKEGVPAPFQSLSPHPPIHLQWLRAAFSWGCLQAFAYAVPCTGNTLLLFSLHPHSKPCLSSAQPGSAHLGEAVTGSPSPSSPVPFCPTAPSHPHPQVPAQHLAVLRLVGGRG